VTKRTPNFEKILAPTKASRPGNEGAYRSTDDTQELTADEAGAIVAIAYHMATADGVMAGDERDFWDALVEHFASKTERSALAALVARLEQPGGASTEENVRAFAAMIRRPSIRQMAYKAAYALRVWDLESNDDEDDLDDVLVEALAVGEIAGDLANEVNEALMV
jgi:uncharacterized tellurite resistance protein B-like protein